jgi:hypothetical protein
MKSMSSLWNGDSDEVVRPRAVSPNPAVSLLKVCVASRKQRSKAGEVRRGTDGTCVFCRVVTLGASLTSRNKREEPAAVVRIIEASESAKADRSPDRVMPGRLGSVSDPANERRFRARLVPLRNEVVPASVVPGQRVEHRFRRLGGQELNAARSDKSAGRLRVATNLFAATGCSPHRTSRICRFGL